MEKRFNKLLVVDTKSKRLDFNSYSGYLPARGFKSSTSLHIEQKRHYSVKALKKINNANIDPNYITGFSDGESTFSFTISKRDSGSKLTWVINPFFSIELDKKDTVLLKKIQSYFKVGKLKSRTNRNEQIIF